MENDGLVLHYITRSQYSSMEPSVCSMERSGFQPVCFRIFSVLPKMIFSSEGRISRATGRISAFTPARRIAVRKQVRQSRACGRAQIVSLTALPFRGGQIETPYSVVHVRYARRGFRLPTSITGDCIPFLIRTQLSHEIRRRIIGFSWSGSVEESQVNCGNFVIQEILSRQQVQSTLC